MTGYGHTSSYCADIFDNVYFDFEIALESISYGKIRYIRGDVTRYGLTLNDCSWRPTCCSLPRGRRVFVG